MGGGEQIPSLDSAGVALYSHDLRFEEEVMRGTIASEGTRLRMRSEALRLLSWGCFLLFASAEDTSPYRHFCRELLKKTALENHADGALHVFCRV
jgi:hypothetical protein